MLNPNLNQQFLGVLISNLRHTFSAKSNDELQKAWAWLQSNYQSPLMAPTITEVLTGSYDRYVQQAVCSYLKKTWKVRSGDLSALVIFQSETLELAIAREYKYAIMELLQRLSGEEKRVLIQRTLEAIPKQTNIRVSANLIVLLGGIVESFDSCNLLQNEERFGKGIYAVLGAALAQVRAGLNQVVDMEIFQQGQMNLLELRLEVARDAIEIIVKILEKANEEATMYYEMLARLSINTQFVKFIEEGIKLNVAGQTQIIWNSPLKQQVVFNAVKGDLLRLSNQIFQKPLNSLFEPVIQTLMLNDSRCTDENIITILTECLVMAERFVLSGSFFDYFASNKLEISLCVFGYCIADNVQIDMMEDSPERFVELARDFCEYQQQPELKAKASALISTLCSTIDGLLSIAAQALMVMLDASLIQQQERHQKYASLMEKYSQFRYGQAKPQEIVQSSLLILASLYDQMESRTDLKGIALQLVAHRAKLVVEVNLLCRNRFILFSGYYPCTVYLELFPKLLVNAHQSTVLQISASFSKVIAQQVRPEMQDYLRTITRKILVKIPCLSTVMDNLIEKNFEVINEPETLNIVFRRLSEDLQTNYKIRPSNMISNVNRLSIMVCHALGKCREPSTYEPYFLNIFQLLPLCPNCEQSILQIATCYLDSCQHVTHSQSQFLKLILQILEKNNFVLNTCFEVLSRHLIFGNKQEDRSMILKAIVLGLDKCDVLADVWEFATLAQLAIIQAPKQDQNLLVLLKGIYDKMKTVEHKTIQHKLLTVYLSLFYRFPQNAVSIIGGMYPTFISGFLQTHKHLPTKQSKQSKQVHVVYMLHLAEVDCKLQTYYTTKIVNIVVALLEEIYETEKKSEQHEQSPYDCDDAVIICINLKQKNLKHPLGKIDVFELLTQKWENIMRLRPQVKDDQSLNKQLLSRHLSNRMVQEKVRRIVKIRR